VRNRRLEVLIDAGLLSELYDQASKASMSIGDFCAELIEAEVAARRLAVQIQPQDVQPGQTSIYRLGP
jgi:hypothetical protein